MPRLIDSHFHLDFIQDLSQRSNFLAYLSQLGGEVVAQTLLPGDFIKWQGPKPAYLAVGFHPWWIREEDLNNQLQTFKEGLKLTRFIGEVGLDFSSKRLEQVPKSLQIKVFQTLLDLISQAASPKGGHPYVMSVHCVQAADTLLDMIADHAIESEKLVVILHGFKGTSDQVVRHSRMGGYLSIQADLLATKKGRAYVQQVAADQLLLETDWPKTPNSLKGIYLANQVYRQLNQTLEGISKLRQQDMAQVIAANQKRLYEGS